MAIIILLPIRIFIFIIVTNIMEKASHVYNIPGLKHDNCNHRVYSRLLTDLPRGN